jgi:hypothetical protein
MKMPLNLSQGTMDQIHGDGALADGRRHALYIARTDIADGEYGGQAGLEHLRSAAKSPCARRVCSVSGAIRRLNVSASKDEAFVVERNAPLQPFRARRCSRHDEDMTDFVR